MPYQDEIEWRDLIRKPEKLFGYSYLYFLVALVAVGLLYLANLRAVGRNAVAPGAPADSTAFVTDIPFQSPRVIPPVDVMKAAVSTPEALNRGRDLFKANCASCHGDNGQGDGPSGLLMNPRPRNFHVLTGWTNGDKVSQIYKTLQEGIVKNGMASFNYLPPADRFALIHVVRSFVPGHAQDSPDELKQLDATYELSKGMNIAGQIPVGRAMQIVENETAPDVQSAQAFVAAAALSPDAGADVFRRVARDTDKAAATLMRLRRTATADDLMRSVCADPVSCGFAPAVARLTAPEWSALRTYAAAHAGGGY
jgi:mono/diheme cytochrome c family protein